MPQANAYIKLPVAQWRSSVFCPILLTTAQGRITTSISFRSFTHITVSKSKETQSVLLFAKQNYFSPEIQWILWATPVLVLDLLFTYVSAIASYLLEVTEMVSDINVARKVV